MEYIPYSQNIYISNKCPYNKIRNPVTNRCVLKSGKIGRSILDTNKTRSKSNKTHRKGNKTHRKGNACPEEKVRNPVTNRCVLKSGKIGRSILDTNKPLRKSNVCPPDKIRNPVTNRCVLKSGKIGRSIDANKYNPSINNPVTNRYNPSINNPVTNRYIPRNVVVVEPADTGLILPSGGNIEKINQLIEIGSPLVAMSGFLYLMERFPNDCTVLADVDVYKKGRLKFTDFEFTYIQDKGIKPPKGFWKSVRKCNNKRFILMPMNIVCSNGQSHANMLLYDANKKSLERFEPNGILTKEEDECLSDIDIDKLIIKAFTTNLGKKFITEYHAPTDFCPRIGIQWIQTAENIGTTSDPEGFCMAWSFWYANLRLANPDLDRSYVLDVSINTIKNMDVTYTDFIRTYSSAILEYHRELVKSKDSIKTFIKYSKKFSD